MMFGFDHLLCCCRQGGQHAYTVCPSHVLEAIVPGQVTYGDQLDFLVYDTVLMPTKGGVRS